MTRLHLTALSRLLVETALWAAETARPWMRRASSSVGMQRGLWVADLEMEE